MHSDALCTGIVRSVACEKGLNSRSLLPKSAALVAVDRGDHALANRLAIVVGSIVDKIASCLYTFLCVQVVICFNAHALDARSGY